MSQLTPLVSAHHGAFFMMDQEGEEPVLKLVATYAYKERKSVSNRFRSGDGSGRPVRAGEEDHPPHPGARGLHPDQLGLGRGQLDDRFNLALEEHRQDDDVERRRLAQPRADSGCSPGTRVRRMVFFSSAHWSDQTLARAEAVETLLRSLYA